MERSFHGFDVAKTFGHVQKFFKSRGQISKSRGQNLAIGHDFVGIAERGQLFFLISHFHLKIVHLFIFIIITMKERFHVLIHLFSLGKYHWKTKIPSFDPPFFIWKILIENQYSIFLIHLFSFGKYQWKTKIPSFDPSFFHTSHTTGKPRFHLLIPLFSYEKY